LLENLQVSRQPGAESKTLTLPNVEEKLEGLIRVKGMLIKGFEFHHALQHPFARAVFMMFMESEIHSFADGNGRVARVMMNAEMVMGKMSKIMIPTLYCEDYFLALRQLS
jgi:Fic family protein